MFIVPAVTFKYVRFSVLETFLVTDSPKPAEPPKPPTFVIIRLGPL